MSGRCGWCERESLPADIFCAEHAKVATAARAYDTFGQCVPRDATLNERVEAAAALLCLSDPLLLVEALRDAGLRIVAVEQALNG